MFTDTEITEINQLLKEIVGVYEDTIQDIWVKIIGEGITDRHKIALVARQLNKSATVKTYYRNKGSVSLSKPLRQQRPNADSTDRTLEDTLVSPTEDDPSDLATRVIGVSGGYGRSTPTEKIVADSHKIVCKFCFSAHVVKNGTRTKSNKAQYWLCRTCGRGFTANGALPRMRFPRYVVQEAVRLRTANFSLPRIQSSLYAVFKVNVSDTMLCKWFDRLAVVPAVRDKHWKKSHTDLASTLVNNFSRGVSYPEQDILIACGYSPRTKKECTQVFRQGMVQPLNGEWVVSDDLYDIVQEAESLSPNHLANK